MQGIYSSKDKLLLYNFGKQPEINMKLVFQWLLSYELQCNEINFAHTFSAAADKRPMISFEKKNKYFEILMCSMAFERSIRYCPLDLPHLYNTVPGASDPLAGLASSEPDCIPPQLFGLSIQ